MTRRTASDEHLARVPLFALCSKAELARLGRHTTTIYVAPGKVLVAEGGGSYEFFAIVEGEAEVTRGGKPVATLRAGDFFGELGLLEPAARDATVTARTPMQVVVLSKREFDAALAEAPGMARKLLAGMARRLRQLDQRS